MAELVNKGAKQFTLLPPSRFKTSKSQKRGQQIAGLGLLFDMTHGPLTKHALADKRDAQQHDVTMALIGGQPNVELHDGKVRTFEHLQVVARAPTEDARDPSKGVVGRRTLQDGLHRRLLDGRDRGADVNEPEKVLIHDFHVTALVSKPDGCCGSSPAGRVT